MKKPIIGIVGRPDIATEQDRAIYVSENYRKGVIAAGGNPILILPPQLETYIDFSPRLVEALKEEEKQMLIEQVKRCDGVLLPGGYRIYEYDCFLADFLIDHDIPVLGICMGMQALASYEKRKHSKSVKHTEKNKEDGLNHRRKKVKYAHTNHLVPGTHLASLFSSSSIRVNSFHRYHVKEAPGFVISAYSEDGLIEAIELPKKRYVLGVQWHPEVMQNYCEEQKEILVDFVRTCRERRPR